MARILQKLGLEPVVAREVETGLLTMVLGVFALLAIHTVGLSIVIHFNQIATAVSEVEIKDSARPGEGERLAPGKQIWKCDLLNKKKGEACE